MLHAADESSEPGEQGLHPSGSGSAPQHPLEIPGEVLHPLDPGQRGALFFPRRHQSPGQRRNLRRFESHDPGNDVLRRAHRPPRHTGDLGIPPQKLAFIRSGIQIHQSFKVVENKSEQSQQEIRVYRATVVVAVKNMKLPRPPSH